MKNYSIWEREKMPEFPELRENLNVEVLVVGGGIAGLLTAYELKKSGVDCVVAERDRICGGTTGKTTAKVTFQHGLIYGKIAQIYGYEKAKMYLAANRNALKRIAELSRNIDCDFRKTDSYIYSRNNRKALLAEVDALGKIGFVAQFCEGLELPFPTAGAVKFPNQAEFNPLKFLSGIAKDLRIFEHTQITEIHGNTAISKRGKITAKKIVIAAHFPFINRFGSYYLKMYQSRSYVVALDNSPQLNGIYMDENKNGFSFRNYGKFLLIAGGAHKTGEPSRFDELKKFAEKAYPGGIIRYAWSAQDCMTLDGIPYIGRYSEFTPDLFVATGFNKWGITTAMAAADILRDMILEKRSDFAAVFDPARSVFHKQLPKNIANAAKNLLTPAAPRCPHMGCALKWNRAEKTWDCPCHGSRFTEDGRLLENPANRDLK